MKEVSHSAGPLTSTLLLDVPQEPDLSMRQVVALVVVQRQAQAALVLPQVVAHEIRILRQIDGLQGQPPQPLSPVDGLEVQSGRMSVEDRAKLDIWPKWNWYVAL